MATSPAISKVQLVTIPTTDQERSVAFFESLGFEKRLDVPWAEGARWVEVYPQGDDTGLAIVPHGADPVGVRTGIILNTPDIDATYTAMVALASTSIRQLRALARRRGSASALSRSRNLCQRCSGSAILTATSF